jgi:hypothetical protein
MASDNELWPSTPLCGEKQKATQECETPFTVSLSTRWRSSDWTYTKRQNQCTMHHKPSVAHHVLGNPY